MLTEYLAFRGIPTVCASQAQKALETALAKPPALILMDVAMPEMDGLEATRRLRQNPRTAACIIVAVTARALNDDGDAARNAGVDGFVFKPFDIKTLGDDVIAILESGRTVISKLASVQRL
jgi:CheY-like chemotaxis protein